VRFQAKLVIPGYVIKLAANSACNRSFLPINIGLQSLVIIMATVCAVILIRKWRESKLKVQPFMIATVTGMPAKKISHESKLALRLEFFMLSASLHF